MAACGSYGIKCDPDMSFQPDCYPPTYQCEQQAVHEPTGEMDLAGFLEMDDKILSELAAGGSKQPTDHTEWTSLFDDVLDPSTGLPLMSHTVSPLSPTLSTGVVSSVPHMDGWVLEETKKLEAQQRIQQRKLLDLKQTLIKTEILKNQLQIHASISQQQQHLQHHQQLSPPLPLHSVPSPPSSTPNQPQPSVTSPPSLLHTPSGHSGSSFTFSRAAGVTTSSRETGGITPKLPISRLPSNTYNSSNQETSMCIDQEDSPPGSPPQDPEKRKVHNLIEKKYRSSINDRIGLLRDMVSKHSKDNKKLQKSAVLQKTIDFIRHLEATIRKLHEENRQLKEMLVKATGQAQSHMTGYNQSPPVTPPSLSPRSSVSGEDSGVPPSSPDCDSGNCSPSSQTTYLPSHLLHSTLPTSSSMSHLLMCVLLVAVFFVNPLYFTGHHSHIIGGHTPGGMRTLSSFNVPMVSDSTDGGYMIDVVWWGVTWLIRLLVAAVCFGWIHIRSVAPYDSSSPDGVKFWRFWKQAQQDLHMGEYNACRDSVESALTVIGRPVPTSSFSLAISLLWATLSHIIFQVVLGMVGVYIASLLERKVPLRRIGAASCKKHGFRVTSSEVAQAYHLLHQLSMTARGTDDHLKGLGLYFSLSALNFAETDRPMKRLPGPVIAEMYISLGLQSSLSVPYISSFAMWYYLFRSRNQSPSQLPAQLKWTVTPRGKSFLLNGKWVAEVNLGSRLYRGPAALPLYSVSRAFCKSLLCEAFNTLLLPPLPTSPTQPPTDNTREEFKYILSLAKEATSSLLPCHTSPGSYDSGFAAIQWWASLGLVACYWTAGEDQEAKAYYSLIEGMLGDSTPVPTALHLAFKALRLHKRPHGNQATPTSMLLQLCGVTSNALQTCVTDVLQDHSDSVENELHQLGLLLACDWLLELRISLWEGDGNKAEDVGRELAPGFYQDLDTLAKLVSLLPTALPRLRLYKGCYQLMAGANPMLAQNMLNSTGRSSLLRRRGLDKEWKKVNSPALFSHEQAMAQLLAYKHLPPSLDPSQQDMPPPPSSPNKHS